MDDLLEIPAKIQLQIPWAAINAIFDTEKHTPDPEPVAITQSTDTGTGNDVVYLEDEEKVEVDYLEDRQLLRVHGYALMPGRYTGMNGLKAEYDHDVIKQDGLDLTGRPVGEMHQKGNSGYVHSVIIDEITAKMRIGTEIYDADAIQKIKQGVYTGFSIDTKVWGYEENGVFLVKKIGFSDGRVDLVDRPACKECLFLDVEDIPTSAAQQTLIRNMEVSDMTDEVTISKEEHESLLKAKKDLEQAKIAQAAEKETEKVRLIKEIKLRDPTFDAGEYLSAADNIGSKLSMLKAYNSRLEQLEEDGDQTPDDIPAPQSTAQAVAQGSGTPIPEVELSTHDVRQFIRDEFMETFRTDLGFISMHEDFKESFESLLEEEARDLLNVAGD